MSTQIISALRARSAALVNYAEQLAAGEQPVGIPLSGGRTAVPDEAIVRWLAAEFAQLASLAEVMVE